MKTLLLSCLCIMITYTINFAQLSGSYTIGGTSPDYATFTDAVNDLEANGISGPVVFNVRDGVYNEQVVFHYINGSTTVNTITIQSESNDSTTVTVQYVASALKLDSVQYMTIKSMKFEALGPLSGNAVYIDNNCNNLTFEGNIFKGVYTPSVFDSRVVYVAGTYENDTLVFRSNLFIDGEQGLFLFGTTGNNANSNVVEYNHFVNQHNGAMVIEYQDAPLVQYNIISTDTVYHNYNGINIQYCDDSIKVLSNKIDIVSGKGIYIKDSDGLPGNEGLIANNFISNACASTYSEAGIYVYNSNYFNYIFNNVNSYGGDTLDYDFFIDVSSTDNDNMLLNNNLVNNGAGFAMYIHDYFPFATIDYNNYFILGDTLAYNNGAYAVDLTELQTQTGMDAHSVFIDPLYVSDTDLHILQSLLANTGTPYSGVDVDFDGDLRNPTTPTIGADEYDSTTVYINNHVVDEITIYPNPTSGVIYIDCNQPVSYEIINLQGNILTRSYLNSDEHAVDVDNLSPGIYLIRLVVNNKCTMKRIVVL